MTEYDGYLLFATVTAFYMGWGCRIAYTEWRHNRTLRRAEQGVIDICKMTVLADKWLGVPVHGAKRVEGRWYVRLDDTDKTYSELSGLLASN